MARLSTIQGVDIVFAKFAQCVTGESDGLIPSPCFRHPADFLDAAHRLVHAYDMTKHPSHKPAEAMVDDLVHFMRCPPRALCERLRREPWFRTEPKRAWHENRHGIFWELASLIQDVWEHAHGPERQLDEEITAILGRLAVPPVCDLGAGAGRFAVPLAEAGLEVRCIENNGVKRMFLRFRAARRRLGRRLIVRPWCSWYRTIVAINVLDHLASPITMLGALANRLAPGGQLLYRATFADDGWHCGGPELRQDVHRQLFQFFEPLAREDGSPYVMTMIKRSKCDHTVYDIENLLASPHLRFGLDPSVRLIELADDSERSVVASPILASEPLIVSRVGRELLMMLRMHPCVHDVLTWADNGEIDREQALATISEWFSAGFIYIKPSAAPRPIRIRRQRFPREVSAAGS